MEQFPLEIYFKYIFIIPSFVSNGNFQLKTYEVFYEVKTITQNIELNEKSFLVIGFCF